MKQEIEEKKIENCKICGEKYIIKSEDTVCPNCFNGCSDPSYHNDGYCDGSC